MSGPGAPITAATAATPAGGGDQLGGAPGRARGGVGLRGVVQLDDLDGLVEPRGLPGEPHEEDRADGEVGGDEHPDALVAREHRLELGEPLRRPPGGTDDGVHALLDAVPDVGR